MTLPSANTTEPVIIGMVHLPPLPGAPGYVGEFEAVRQSALRDARRLRSGGVDGILVENFGDTPFYPDGVPKHVVASMTTLVANIRETVDCPLGVNVLRNDVAAALSVATVTGGSFVRANVHAGARVTDQGIIEGRAHETVRLRDRLGSDVAILADLDVKHSAPLSSGSSGTIEEIVERGAADGAIVSGSETGEPVDREWLQSIVERRNDRDLDVPVFVGSGVTAANVAELLSIADGAIVGTSLKKDGITTNPVDMDAVRELVDAARE